MWAQVKFVLDKTLSAHPITPDFKECEIIESELKSGKIRDKYYVFWSNTEETPADVIHREKRIVQIEKVLNSAQAKAPVAGYYEATLLKYADSEEDLIKLIDDPNPKTRRPIKPNLFVSDSQDSALNKKKAKAKNEKAAHVHNLKRIEKTGNFQPPQDITCANKPSSQKDSECATEKDSMEKVKDLKETGESFQSEQVKRQQIKRNQYFQKRKRDSTSDTSSDFDNCFASDYFEEGEDVPHWEHAKLLSKNKKLSRKLKEKKEEFEKLQNQITELQTKNDQLLNLNLMWQQKYKEGGKFKTKHSKHSHHKSLREDLSTRGIRDGLSVKKAPEVTREQADKRVERSGSIQLFHDDDSLSFGGNTSEQGGSPRFLTSSPIPGTSPLRPNFVSLDTVSLMSKSNSTGNNTQEQVETRRLEIIDNSREGEDAAPSVHGTQELNILQSTGELPAFGVVKAGVKPITMEQFKICIQPPVQEGKAGDSLFVKNISSLLWTRAELQVRSATGQAAVNSKEPPRPPCTPSKKEYIKELLQRRIGLEKKEVLEVDALKRCDINRINEYLRAKIKGLRRGAVQQT